MDSRNSNLYPINNDKTDEIFNGYIKNQCIQQTSTEHFLPSYTVPVDNNMSQPVMYNSNQNQPVYNIMYPHQTVYCNQNSYTTNYTQSIDWSDTCMKNNDYKEKYIPERKKENCCVENITTDTYVTKNLYNYNKNNLIDPQRYYGNCESQKYSELPSCSQIPIDNVKDQNNIKSVKYCSIQKLPETDPKLYGYTKQYDNNMYINQYNKINKDYSSCSQLTQTCNLYSESTFLEIDKKILLDQYDLQTTCDVLSSQYYPTNDNSLQPYIDVPKLIEKSDDSNGNGGESDIIVEESEEESDDSEDIDKEISPCIICRSNIANIFYDITSDLTVTTFSQTKISEKIFQILGWISHASKNLCNDCMTILNNYDQLEIQLDSIRQKILDKYKLATKFFIDNKENQPIIENIINNEVKTCVKIRKKIKLKPLNFQCRVCKKIFCLRKFYKYHMSKHKRKYSFLCEHCGYKFPTKLRLLMHLKNHNKKCSFCNKIIMKNHVCTQERVFICHLCGKMFKSKTNIKEHENICSGNLPFKCPGCERQFPSKTKLNQHIKLAHEQKYCNTCQKCGKGFVKKSDYKAHLISHSNEKKFKCGTCGKIYKSLSNLNQHKKIHNETLPYICMVCQKGFLRKENLESHLNNHNGVKPFNCTICEKKFVSQKNLDAHLKIHNGTIKKKTCDICGKQLIHGLAEHMRTHSNFKAFGCVECSMKFLTKGALAKHIKRKHENKELDVLQI